MGAEIIIVLLVVGVIVGPIATLRAVSYYRGRAASKAKPKDDDNPDDKGSFW